MVLEEMTMEAFRKGLAKSTTIILPVGSVEEHGGHLPLGTDTIHAYELAKNATSLHDFFVAPPLWYGLCRSTSQHPGTVSISGAVLRSIIIDILGSFYDQGLRNFVILSGHAGGTHMAMLVDAGEHILNTLPECKVAVLSVLDLVAQLPVGVVETENDSHAGEVETALMQHLRKKYVCGTSPEEYPSFPKHILVRNKKRFWSGGVWGDPSKASPEKGEKILDLEAENLVKLIKQLESWNE